MDEMQALKDAIAQLDARITEFFANQQAEIMALINEAILADDAEEAIDLKKMKDDVLAIVNRIPPRFEPSNQ